MPKLAEVRELAFSLSAEDQLILVRELRQRLEDEWSWDDEELCAEAARRLARMDAEGNPGIPLEIVMERLRNRNGK